MCLLSGSSTSNYMNWQKAKRYSQDLTLDGYSDWRLPNMEELYYLGDVSKSKPAINSRYFNVKNSYYWSFTTCKWASSSAWVVGFEYGGDSNYGKSDDNYVLCVRGQ